MASGGRQPPDWAVELPFIQVNNFDVLSHGYKPVGGLFPETSIGWYRKHFTLNNITDKKVTIYFDGVYMNSDVWINEHHLGNHPYGYTPFYYDITPYLKQNGENVLAVRVRNVFGVWEKPCETVLSRHLRRPEGLGEVCRHFRWKSA